MRNIGSTFLAILLAVGTGQCLAATSTADIPNPDKAAAARSAELQGDLARARNNFASAAFNYQKAVRIDARNSALYNKLAIAELKLGDNGSARKHLNQAIKYNPRNVAALNNLGALACIERKYKPAVRYLKQALALDESSASAHLNMAEAWFGMGEVDRAMTEYSRALELDADILTAGQNGVIAQVTTPEQRARVSYLIAKAYAKRGNVDGALEYLQRAKQGGYRELRNVYSDQEFAALWPDPRLEKIVKR